MDKTTIILIALIIFLRFIFPIIRQRNFLSYNSLLEMKELNKKLLLLDVRTRNEYNSGHIPGSKNISHDKLAMSLPKAKKDSPIIVYCRSGQRAGVAKKTLERAGFTDVQNFGGISRWKGDLDN